MMIYPLKFQPIYKERIWGTPKGKRIGESWELADLPEDKSIIANGEFTGQTLESVIRKYPKELTGSEGLAIPFPLLLKFLDCGDVLSIQVHPDEATCKRLGMGNFKAECWYIVKAKPGAIIYKGLKEGVTRERFSRAIKEGTVEQTLRKIEVKAGQCYYLPAGTPHALGAGLLIAEIETPSDTTFRIFDWNRVDENGKPRPLHINEALESIHFDSADDNIPVRTTGRLVESRFFNVDRGRRKQNSAVPLSAGQMKTLIFLSGSGTIVSGNNAVEFNPGQTLLIPAAYRGVLRFSAETEYLTVTT
ncbi:MAG: type I phosphomannose isomerase catalytic subunit [Sedimentisphaerales bacterium]